VKRALISDIHSNLEALRAVLDHIRGQGVTDIHCLGDVVGYGPNPAECLDMVMKMPLCILGNHDQAAMFDPEGFNPVALNAIYWTRDQLESARGQSANRRWDFLGELPRTYQHEDLLYVHGSPREPTNEYVFPEDVYNRRKMENLFGRITRYCFNGHTHIPGVFTEEFDFITPEDCNHEFKLMGKKALINVGSVGQPRDGDPRSCYVTLEDDVVRFHRVDYPYMKTAEKIYAVPDLDNMLGDRLRDGR